MWVVVVVVFGFLFLFFFPFAVVSCAVELSVFLLYCATSLLYWCPTFWDSMVVPSSWIVQFFIRHLTLEDGTTLLTQNVGQKSPIDCAICQWDRAQHVPWYSLLHIICVFTNDLAQIQCMIWLCLSDCFFSYQIQKSRYRTPFTDSHLIVYEDKWRGTFHTVKLADGVQCQVIFVKQL